jgi:hypothetical protein
VTERAREQGQEIGVMSTRTAAWLAWSLLGALVGGCGRERSVPGPEASTPTEASRGPAVLGIGFVLVFMSFATVGALVASRQPRNLIGWIFGALGLFLPLASASEEYALYALVTQPGSGSETHRVSRSQPPQTWPRAPPSTAPRSSLSKIASGL